VKREDIVLNAEVTPPVNAEMKVGSVEETVVVKGESPVVDVQNVASRTVMTREVMDAIPQGRNIQAVGIMIPGTALQVGGGGALSRDVGGSGTLQQSPLAYRGSVASVQTVEGMRLNNLCGSSAMATIGTMACSGDFLLTGADSAEMGQGGLRINMIEGWRQHVRGTLFSNWTGDVERQPDGRSAAGSPTSAKSGRSTTSIHRSADRSRRTACGFRRRSGVRGSKTVVDSYFDGDAHPVRYEQDLTRPGLDDGTITSASGD
jgi:hypothetical protein